MGRVNFLRLVHGVFALYFLACLAYLWYAGVTGTFDALLTVAVTSLILEGIAVFVLNHGDCPRIHVQRKVGDETPFFELFLSRAAAKKAIPVLTGLTAAALGLLVIQFIATKMLW